MDGAYTARMYFGAHNIWQDEETQIERVSHDFQIHEEWESDILKNDIALIKLTTPIEYSNYKEIWYIRFLDYKTLLLFRYEHSGNFIIQWK